MNPKAGFELSVGTVFTPFVGMNFVRKAISHGAISRTAMAHTQPSIIAMPVGLGAGSAKIIGCPAG